MEFAIYLFKVSGCLVVLYIPYTLFFRRTTLFVFNRYYLLAALVVSFMIPAIHFTLPAQWASVNKVPFPIDSFSSLDPHTIDDFQLDDNGDPVRDTNTFLFYTGILYFFGSAIVLFRFIGSVMRIIQMKQHSYPLPFSFFHRVFLPSGEIDPLIFAHEKVHVDERHWVDLILLAVASILVWFNPILILYRRSVRIQHEYLADSGTIGKSMNPTEYLTCLLKQLQIKNGLEPVSHFYSTSIKQRIHMITRKKTSTGFSGFYLIMLPLIGMLSLAFSIQRPDETETMPLVDSQENTIPSIMPVDMKKLIKLSSGFGNRIHPQTKKLTFHTGVDFQMAEGEIVMATADGIVTESISDPQWGIYVVIKHDDTYSTSYSHLKSTIVKKGDKMVAGQTLGFVGNTGLSVGPHLHYEVRVSGKAVDPADYLPK